MATRPMNPRDFLVPLPPELGQLIVRLFLERMLGVRIRPGRRLRLPQPLVSGFERAFDITPAKAMASLEGAKPAAMVVLEGERLEAFLAARGQFRKFMTSDDSFVVERFYIFDTTFRWCLSTHICVDRLMKYRPTDEVRSAWLDAPNAAEETKAVVRGIAEFVAGMPVKRT